MSLIHNEIDLARREGVTLPENLPFYIPSTSPSDAAVLLTHGFSASPWEMIPLARHLSKAGFHCFALRLPGHGTNPSDLKTRSLEDWRKALCRGYRCLETVATRIYGVGLSTGSLLTLDLSLREKLSGQILLAPFLCINHRLAPLAGVLSHLRPFQARPVSDALKPYYYERHPLRGIHQINRLTSSLRRNLDSVETPTLVMLSLGDQTVDPESGLELFKSLGTSRRQCHIFGPEIPHTLCTPSNPGLDEVLNLSTAFLRKLETDRLVAPGASTEP